jgi:hypothetical protein
MAIKRVNLTGLGFIIYKRSLVLVVFEALHGLLPIFQAEGSAGWKETAPGILRATKLFSSMLMSLEAPSASSMRRAGALVRVGSPALSKSVFQVRSPAPCTRNAMPSHFLSHAGC